MEKIKEELGQAAANLIENDTIVGLGTGTTAACFIDSLAKRCMEGLSIKALASSKASYELAKRLGMQLLDLSQIEFIDVYVDGADEVDHKKQMIQGRGGALLREKILANSSVKTMIMIDHSKYQEKLGKVLLPVEVTPFGCNLTKIHLEELGYESEFREDENADLYITDNNNYILDVKLSHLLDDPIQDHVVINSIPGVVETGLFIDLADTIIVGHADGKVEFVS